MKPLSLTLGNPVFQNIRIPEIKQVKKENLMSLQICLLSFILLAVPDIILTIKHELFLETILIGSLAICNTVFSFINFSSSFKKLLTVLYSIVLFCISGLIVIYGFSSGCYFYLFPSAIVYAINTNSSREKVKFNVSFFSSIVLFGWISLFFLISITSVSSFLFTNLFALRLAMSVFLTAVLTRYMLSFYTAKEEKITNNSNSDVLFHANREAYLVLDRETQTIVDHNQFAAGLFDIPGNTSITGIFISQFMMRYLSGSSINLDTLMNKLPDNWQGEGIFTTHNKKEFKADVNSFIYLKDEKEYQVMGIRDVSDLKKAETDLAYYKDKLEKSAQVKSRFLSSMSHELRTPLNGIIGSANLILAEQDLPEKVKSQINLQLYSSEHMLSIINDILDFSKIESGKMELKNQSFNLLEALGFLMSSVQSQSNKNNIKLVSNFDPKLTDVTIVSDLVKLRQILFNLVSNALKFTFDGQVEIKAEVKDAAEENITVFFSVTDSGIGIKKEKQSEIFDDFVQVHDEDALRKFGGTGLGLTISEKLVNLLGGKIALESEYGKGSSFYFTLSFNKDVKKEEISTPLPAEPEIYTAPADIRGVRILIAEDNEVNAAILIKFLTKWGIRIKEAGNGIQALELMKYHKFDLVLMDLEMPEMNGYDAVKIIRETDTEIPVIAFTATLLENMESLILKNGFNDYILKPFRPADLKKKIEKFINHRKIEYA